MDATTTQETIQSSPVFPLQFLFWMVVLVLVLSSAHTGPTGAKTFSRLFLDTAGPFYRMYPRTGPETVLY